MLADASGLSALFRNLDRRIDEMKRDRAASGLMPIAKAKVQLLGQISLMINDRVSAILSLAQTGDVDALLMMEHSVKAEFQKLLCERGLVYDEDSYLIWIPPGSVFTQLVDLENVLVEVIDPESALVSKAVKAPAKNLQLIRQAIASGSFPTLVERLLRHGGSLEDFA